jgi:hypothetical protein
MSESHDRQLMPRWPVPLREATPYGQAPRYLICDNVSKFGSCYRRVAKTSGIKLLKTPVHTPRANAVCERFLRSVRQECLDHLLILQEKQLHVVLKAYVAYAQSGTAASRDWAADTRTKPINSFRKSRRREGDRSSSEGWNAP